MDNENARSAYVVAAMMGDLTQYWAAATQSKEAIVAVQLHVGPSWAVQLTNRRLSNAQVESLSLRRDEVRRLR
jgi:hypothetical protein